MGNEKTGNRRQETGDSFKPLLPICKTSTPDPLERVTPASGGQARETAI
jgi:hypothetical protein